MYAADNVRYIAEIARKTEKLFFSKMTIVMSINRLVSKKQADCNVAHLPSAMYEGVAYYAQARSTIA